jgi:signal transduction histidine kinase
MVLTFRARLILSHVFVVVAAVVLLSLQVDRVLREDVGRRLDERLEQQVRGATRWGAGEGHRHPDKVAGKLAAVVDADVTIFDVRGKVLADSTGNLAAGEIPPEVTAALGGSVGRASRSGPQGEQHFVAVATTDGWVFRLSAPLSGIEETARITRRRTITASLLAALVAIVLGLLLSRAATMPLGTMTAAAKRMAEGDFDVPLGAPSADEFGVLARSLQSLAQQLKTRIQELERERSHVQRLLVAAIQGFAETLLGSSLGEAERQHAETIHRHAGRIGALVSDMLRLSALESEDGGEQRAERVTLSGVASSARESLEPLARQCGAKVVTQIPADFEVWADPQRLEQVFENLLSNALKYGRQGGTVVVSAAFSGAGVEFRISDDGEGIAAEHLPRLFDRFYRVDPARARETGGTGLGLAIVRELVLSMRGKVRVESERGKGTSFVVWLPSADAPAA